MAIEFLERLDEVVETLRDTRLFAPQRLVRAGALGPDSAEELSALGYMQTEIENAVLLAEPALDADPTVERMAIEGGVWAF